ncbi:glyoxalase I [Plasmodium cynomolgi strain B]|uniref:Glyoxalase I n=1 Tax=Plasmodium cynomolgi (strain B) TaxID=1120755 RepID=K6VE34_PLACD|nr:glyoxalase I [Plasmodium cynomolgi strain B]GAB67497.1 glyoxalase I [Plasmodium cynomolgi strain B]
MAKVALMKRALLWSALLCFNGYYFLKLPRSSSYSFLTSSNIVGKKVKNPEEPNRSKRLKCRVEGIEYTVRNVDQSIEFYKNVLGFQVREKGDDFVKMALGPEEAYIKLVQKGEQQDITIGEHCFLGLGVNMEEFQISKTKIYGGNVEDGIDKRPITACILPDEDVGGESFCTGAIHAQIRRFSTNCFVTDPDGYGIEVVLQGKGSKLDRIRFFTTSTKDSQKFYSDILGMELIRIQSHLEEISYPWSVYGGMSYFFSSGRNATVLQMAYAYDEDKLHMGNSLGNLILSFNDLAPVEKRLRENGIQLEESHNGWVVKDLDGYSVRLKSDK